MLWIIRKLHWTGIYCVIKSFLSACRCFENSHERIVFQESFVKNPHGLPTKLDIAPWAAGGVPVSEVHLDLRRFKTSFDFINNYFPLTIAEAREFSFSINFLPFPYGNSDCCIDINRFAIVTSNLLASLISKRKREKRHTMKTNDTWTPLWVLYSNNLSFFDCSFTVTLSFTCAPVICVMRFDGKHHHLSHVTCNLIFEWIYFLFRERSTIFDLMYEFRIALR